MFDLLIVQPIFNLLVLIYALLPGHNFGLAIIIFTIVVRMLMWPLIKKQLHQVKLMRKVQPELKKIKKAAGGDKRKESALMLELYKERGINPFGQIGVLILQIPILLGLYLGLQKVLKNPEELISFAYPALHNLPWLQQLGDNIKLFDATLFGFVDLERAALGPAGIYIPALVIVLASAVIQFYQSKQLTPEDKDARGLRGILRDAKEGKQADQAEVSAAMGRNMRYLLPALIVLFTIQIASALSLYWLVSGLVAFIQQSIILREDVTDMEAVADDGTKPLGKGDAIEGEVIPAKSNLHTKAKKAVRTKKRRRK